VRDWADRPWLARIVFHPRIEADVREVVVHYDGCSAGLGERFKRTFYATVDEIVVWPESMR
jgi:hypothetical protein